MAKQFIVQLNNQHPEQVSWIIAEDSKITPAQSGTIEEFAKEARDGEVVALLPAEDVLLTSIRIPITSKAKLLKAAPYALEEELAQDITQLHFALGESSHNITPVAVISHDVMSQWRQRFAKHHIELKKMTSELLVIPYTNDEWHIQVSKDKTLVRTGKYKGFIADNNNLLVLLQLAIKEEKQKPQKIVINNPENIKISFAEVKEVATIMQKEPVSLIEQYVQSIKQQAVFNFIQGVYQPTQQATTIKRVWKLVAALVIAVVFVQGIGGLVEYVQLSKQNAKLGSRITALYKEVFPQATTVVAPKVRVQRQLAQLRAGVAAGGFLDLLGKAGEALQAQPNVTLQGLDFSNRQLALSLEAPSFAVLEQLSNVLQRKKLIVTQQDAQSIASGVKAKLLIKEE